jgi:RNase P/RNase MRP subunit POP5
MVDFRLRLKLDYRVRPPRDSENTIVRCSRRRNERRQMALCLEGHEAPNVHGLRPGSVIVTFTRVTQRALDDDSLAFAYKSLRDAIADWMGVGDSPTDPVSWRYRQRQLVQLELNPNHGRGRASHRQGPRRYVNYTIIDIKTVGRKNKSEGVCETHEDEAMSEHGLEER